MPKASFLPDVASMTGHGGPCGRSDGHDVVPQLNSAEVADGAHSITVLARCADGRMAADTISVLTSQSGRYDAPARMPGDSVNAIGAYLEKGILGTQLGPNKNGRKW
jgi:Icc protein